MRILNPRAVNAIREHAEESGEDHRAVVIVQGGRHLLSPREVWDEGYTHIRNAPDGSGGRPSPYGCIVKREEFEGGNAPEPGYYWVDVDGTMVDRTEEFGKPDPAIDGWAGIWRF